MGRQKKLRAIAPPMPFGPRYHLGVSAPKKQPACTPRSRYMAHMAERGCGGGWWQGGAEVPVHATTLRDGIDSKTTSVTCYGQPTHDRFASLDFQARSVEYGIR